MSDFVLVHGGNCSGAIWSRMAPHLGGRVLAVDLPGRNDPAEHASASFAAWARAVVGDMDAAGLERAVFVGHSMGGGTLAALAALFPHRAAGFAFFAAVVPPDGGLFLEGLSDRHQAFLLEHQALGAATIPRPSGGRTEPAHPDRAFARVAGSSEALAPFFDRVTLAGLAGAKVGYVKLLDDRSLDATRQNLFIARLRALGPCAVRDLAAGHMAMVSHPRESAGALCDLAGAWR